VVKRTQVDQFFSFECSMCASHGDDFCLFHKQVLGPVQATSEQFESSKLVQLSENFLYVSEAALRYDHVLFVRLALEQVWHIVEETRERELFLDGTNSDNLTQIIRLARKICERTNLSICRLHFAEELFPTGQDVVQEKIACCFTSVCHISRDTHTLLQFLHILQKLQSLCQNIVHTTIPEKMTSVPVLEHQNANEADLLKSFSVSRASSP
jgi:hypothetical protein